MKTTEKVHLEDRKGKWCSFMSLCRYVVMLLSFVSSMSHLCFVYFFSLTMNAFFYHGILHLMNRRRFWPSGLPDVNLRMDPVINFKMKQRISYFGTCVTLGVDYLSDLAQWRAYCGVEDTKLQGRFSLRGSELSWAKSWLVNLGMGEESTAKFKLRLGMNLQTYKAYARLRFRAEPISFFDIGEGLSCAGKLPVPKLPALGTLPLRVEYRLRINTPQQAARSNARRARTASGEDSASENSGENSRNGARRRGKDSDDQVVSLSTGIDSVEVSLDELNFCLEWDEKSPVWGIGLVRTGDRLRGALSAAKPVSAKSMAPNRRKDTDESKIPFSFGKKDKKEKEKDASTPRSAPSTASQPSIHSGIFMDNGLMD